jgi:hypothetical protein
VVKAAHLAIEGASYYRYRTQNTLNNQAVQLGDKGKLKERALESIEL